MMSSRSFNPMTTPQSSSPMGVGMRMRAPGMPRSKPMTKRGMGVPSLGGLNLLKLASGGYIDNPSMGQISVRNAMRGTPGLSLFEYLSERMADGGVPEIVRHMRLRHGQPNYRGSLDVGRHAQRTMLENDPMSWWDRDFERRRGEFEAGRSFDRGQPGMYMEPDLVNEKTQGTIDSVQGPGLPRQALEFLLGDSPTTAVLGAQLRYKGLIPTPRINGLAALLYSGDAGATSDEMVPRDYEGYGRWQPFRRQLGRIR